MSEQPADDRHRRRMQRKKAVVDAAIARADDERRLLLVLTGNGKGKSSSAFGMMARSLGSGMNVAVAQFIKGRRDTGEEAFFRDLPGVTWHVLGEGFTWETQNRARDIETSERGWAVAKSLLVDPAIHLVILDELTYLLRYGYLDVETVLADIGARPLKQHVVVTGRGAPDALIELADTVTEMRDVKHAFRNGVKAQRGIDL
ncbi:MAG: cob(I)yrinic acid a,c-diamide adenosyltransferase [Alphaproteobacteria bacterium]|nr:cob(I)yrinic acid a,c-diamide adenosyltransferase [Alphaproteobacteria bacterium]MDE2112694.1 cob(I)yrinic acid a,c-diamide adenosyltransferase [Alphaproteobacteria bacterium]MDE2494725.1 cob(I)yrinic acid a,c-diamide adenosyltransferase [Alphaproteobacteria bacterium]